MEGQFAYGLQQTGTHDLNLDATPEFALASEGGRPVYSPATAFIPTTGAVSILSLRIHPEYGTVSEFTARNRSLTTQVTVSFGGLTMQGITLNANYTFLRARDQQNGSAVAEAVVEGAAERLRQAIPTWSHGDVRSGAPAPTAWNHHMARAKLDRRHGDRTHDRETAAVRRGRRRSTFSSTSGRTPSASHDG